MCAVARCTEARDVDIGSLGRSKEIDMRIDIHKNPRKFRSRFARRASLYLAALLGGALFAHLPAANAQGTSDHTAAVTTAGVRIEIDTQAWSGEPERFNRLLPAL